MSHLICDGHNLLFKSFAVPFKYYSTGGTPLHVVNTFLSLLKRSVNATTAEKIVVVFDSETQNTNHQLDINYKKNRPQDYSLLEDSPFRHLPLIKRALEILKIPFFEEIGFEGDDVIASIANQQEDETFIVSNDTDFYQLLSPTIKILKLLPKKRYLIVDEQYVFAKLGVKCCDYVWLKCWVGDRSDNIVGIKGIGWKRGLEIIKGERQVELTPLETKRLELNKRLIQLNTDLPIHTLFGDTQLLLGTPAKKIFELCKF